MNKPIKIALLSTGVGTAVVIAIASVYRFTDISDDPMPVGVAVGVFVGMIFSSTNAAYIQGKKDAIKDAKTVDQT